jgi:hypothetical protein
LRSSLEWGAWSWLLTNDSARPYPAAHGNGPPPVGPQTQFGGLVKLPDPLHCLCRGKTHELRHQYLRRRRGFGRARERGRTRCRRRRTVRASRLCPRQRPARCQQQHDPGCRNRSRSQGDTLSFWWCLEPSPTWQHCCVVWDGSDGASIPSTVRCLPAWVFAPAGIAVVESVRCASGDLGPSRDGRRGRSACQ